MKDMKWDDATKACVHAVAMMAPVGLKASVTSKAISGWSTTMRSKQPFSDDRCMTSPMAR